VLEFGAALQRTDFMDNSAERGSQGTGSASAILPSALSNEGETLRFLLRPARAVAYRFLFPLGILKTRRLKVLQGDSK
jgi:hypothetical protein